MIDLHELDEWFKGRHVWLQDAARRLRQNGELKPADIEQLTILCKKESGMDVELGSQPQAIGIPEDALTRDTKPIDLRLAAIKDLQGINALAPKKPLEFGEGNLTIIYGLNGSGKSGYVRVLKHACGARHVGKILSNVYAEAPAAQGCSFIYKIREDRKETAWLTTDGILPDLSTVEIYDSDCGEVYVNEENEVAYEPRLLGFLQKLVEISDAVSEKIDIEIRDQISKKPDMPQNYINTNAWKWYSNLNYQTSEEEIKKWCTWTDDNENLLAKLKARLSEPNPKDKAILLRKQKGHLSNLASDLQRFLDLLAPDNCSAFIVAKKDTQTKRQAASVDAKRVFEKSPLTGVGSESWRLLWEQARAFSEKNAYKDIPFPNVAEGSHCVLCQQPLENSAKVRLRSFEEFIKGGIEKAAEEAEFKLSELQKRINDYPKEDDLILRLDSSGITDEHLCYHILNLYAILERRKAELLIADDSMKFHDPIDRGVIDSLNILADSLEKQAVIFDEDTKNDNRQELQEKLTEIEVRKWLSEKSENIEAELALLKYVKKLAEAKRLTNTKALSDKKSELAEKLITEAYKKRFQDEIENLGAADLKVILEKTGTTKGRVFHKISLKDIVSGVHAAEVLSEGEFRIISLAAFLADIEDQSVKSPIIFDDPVSSLDQDFEETTVKRFIELCKSRQVIVFTHRLSLLALLEEVAEKERIKSQVISLERENWGCGEPYDSPIDAQPTKKAINTLIDQVIRAGKVLNDGGKRAYEREAQNICTNLRKLLERLIERDLLAGVVERFRREVQTKNRLLKVAAISLEDCKLLDDLMTEYSKYEHSQSREAPVSLPMPDQLQTDLLKLKKWREDFEKRK
ncbi:MAG: AAA family ATPase [Thermodesulfovibrionales bacterium]|nr:AAA family ATPase [Thermodesulfovibrionales bacterium]